MHAFQIIGGKGKYIRHGNILFSFILSVGALLFYVSLQNLRRYDSQTHEHRLRRGGLFTPESCTYGSISK